MSPAAPTIDTHTFRVVFDAPGVDSLEPHLDALDTVRSALPGARLLCVLPDDLVTIAAIGGAPRPQ